MEWTTLANILTSKPEDRQHIMKDLSRTAASDMERLCKIAVEVRWKKLWYLALNHGA